MGRAVVYWLRHYTTNRQVVVSIPNGVSGIFQCNNPSSCTMTLGLTQPLIEMSTRCISWGLRGPVHKALPPYHHPVPCVRFAGCCSILQTGHITLSSTPEKQLENHITKYHRQQLLYNTLELLMMGTVVPETCCASNKICNENLCCI